MPPKSKMGPETTLQKSRRRAILVEALRHWRADVVIPKNIVDRIAWARPHAIGDVKALQRLMRGWGSWMEHGEELSEYLGTVDFSKDPPPVTKVRIPRPQRSSSYSSSRIVGKDINSD